MERYRQAAIAPPLLLYVDCGCCISEGSSKLQTRFGEWPDLHIRLDIWHLMRRLAVGCTTDAHPLYPTFMGCLSACIFEWDAGDLSLLRRAKREQLEREGVPALTDAAVDARISKRELSQYCRRRTRGEEATISLIGRLLQELGGANGRDLMGVPLLDQVRMEHIWHVQQRHIKCIQDLPGVQLYTEKGTINKGGVVLTRYRCARGSTSLESFHCHLNRFIPGTSANALNFQLYLLEGLNRWNQDRGTAAVSSRPSSLLTYTYSGDVTQCVNTNSFKVLGRAFVPTFRPPSKYTGELLGIDYLLSQTGQPLQVNPDSEEAENMLEDVAEGEEEDEGFEEDQTPDLMVPGLLDDVSISTQPVSSSLAAPIQPAPIQAAASSQAAPSSLAVDDSGVPGMDRVDSLAEHLVELRNQPSLALTNQQVSDIVVLWQNLLQYDKQRVVFAARFQTRLDTGSEGSSKLQTRFGEWPDLHIRLDIWHLMRRLAVGCTTDAHPLYPTFMGCLSACIFEWDAGDLSLLRRAKREQLEREGVPALTDAAVDARISKRELSQYCRRRTRGEEATISLIGRLLQELGGANGRDLMGVPLLDQVRMEHIWHVQQRHIKCIQDLPGVQLYTEKGTINKGGVVLTRYRCARGSTSLESFHCHLNRFIPGTSANALNFQLYLLEGLNRWNQDRGTAAVSSRPSSLLTYTYSGDVTQCVNTNSFKVLGRAFVPTFRPPSKYTGELLGIDYLLSQTGQPLQVNPDSEEAENMLEDVAEGEEEDEGFEEDQTPDLMVPGLLDDVSISTQPVSSSLAAPIQPAPIQAAASSQAAPSSLAVDDSGVPGMDRVDSLAEHLVELRNQPSLALTNQQVSDIVVLWQNLLQYDKQRVVFAARFQTRLDTGRFRSSKKRQEFTPGVESVKRHALTTTAPLAQWPDCCRLVEAIFIRLCAIHRSPKKRGTGTVSRWDLVLEDYRRIRQRILANGAVMQQTTMQLVDVSHTTLVQWHNKRVKRQDSTVVMQGLDLPSRLSVAADPLPSANIRPLSAPPPSRPRLTSTTLPSSTVGQAQVKRKAVPTFAAPVSVRPRHQRQLFPAPPPPPTSAPQLQLMMLAPGSAFLTPAPVQIAAPQARGVSPITAPPAAPVPVAPAAPVRKLTRRVLHNTCKKCGQFRTAETGHSQYKGTVYCPSVETVSIAQWLEDIKKKR
ncbi:unnamed protein product [Merluccius merluccius]